jgi:hypothetical protein
MAKAQDCGKPKLNGGRKVRAQRVGLFVLTKGEYLMLVAAAKGHRKAA